MMADLIVLYTEHPVTMGVFTAVLLLTVFVTTKLIKGAIDS